MQIGIQTAGLAIWRHRATVEEDNEDGAELDASTIEDIENIEASATVEEDADEWDVSTLEDTEREDAL